MSEFIKSEASRSTSQLSSEFDDLKRRGPTTTPRFSAALIPRLRLLWISIPGHTTRAPPM